MWKWLKKHKIVAVIITIITVISSCITIAKEWKNLLNFFVNLLVKLIELLTIDTKLPLLPLWIIILTLAYILIITIWIICFIYRRLSIANYTKDAISGLIWERGAQEYTDTINLKAFCPNCQDEIDTKGSNNTKTICPKCNAPLPRVSKDLRMINNEFE
jgi:hypothetical protein